MTETTMTKEKAAELRKPFSPEAVGKLPKITCGACSKKSCTKHSPTKCRECGNYLTAAHVHLDYVGHAAVTDRLLAVDPEWNWEPLALDAMGLPALDRQGNLWIRLTICGMTRLGVGDGKSMKEQIGDALRNAAMRFGVGLDLWSKEELEAGALPAATPRDWAAEIAAATSPDLLRLMWAEAGPQWHDAITARVQQIKAAAAPPELEAAPAEPTTETAQETLA